MEVVVVVSSVVSLPRLSSRWNMEPPCLEALHPMLGAGPCNVYRLSPNSVTVPETCGYGSTSVKTEPKQANVVH